LCENWSLSQLDESAGKTMFSARKLVIDSRPFSPELIARSCGYSE
jgi:hypothetical protein